LEIQNNVFNNAIMRPPLRYKQLLINLKKISCEREQPNYTDLAFHFSKSVTETKRHWIKGRITPKYQTRQIVQPQHPSI